MRRVGTTYTLRALAAWPSGNQVTVTIPSGAPAGNYIMEQLGTATTNRPTSNSCTVTVSSAPAAAAATQQSSPTVPLTAIAIGALTLFGLVQLRFRRLRRTAA
jgi:hypothetical protein